MTSVTRLQSYYEDEVLQLQNHLVEQVRKMVQEQQLQQQQQASSASGDLPMMYLGASGDDNIPEIHFPSSEEGESASSAAAVLSLEHATPQLDAGMQMLQSLEQGGLTQQQQQQQGEGPSSTTPTVPAAPSSDVLLNLLAEASPSLQEGAGGGTKKKKKS